MRCVILDLICKNIKSRQYLSGKGNKKEGVGEDTDSLFYEISPRYSLGVFPIYFLKIFVK